MQLLWKKKKRETEIDEKTPKLTSFFKPTSTLNRATEYVEPSVSAPVADTKVDTEVSTISLKSAMADISIDDLGLWPEEKI